MRWALRNAYYNSTLPSVKITDYLLLSLYSVVQNHYPQCHPTQDSTSHWHSQFPAFFFFSWQHPSWIFSSCISNFAQCRTPLISSLGSPCRCKIRGKVQSRHQLVPDDNIKMVHFKCASFPIFLWSDSYGVVRSSCAMHSITPAVKGKVGYFLSPSLNTKREAFIMRW